MRLRQAIKAHIYVAHRPTRMIAAIPYLLSQLIEFFIRELSELHRQFFEYHIVLCQGAGLIR
jgi:hypothetical protein